MAKGRLAGSLSKRYRGGVRGVRVISSRAFSAVGRPSPSVWTDKLAQAPANTKSSVRRLIRRNPAVGRTLPLADKITDTHIDLHGDPGPQVQMRERSASPGSGIRKVRAQGTNRSLKKR